MRPAIALQLHRVRTRLREKMANMSSTALSMLAALLFVLRSSTVRAVEVEVLCGCTEKDLKPCEDWEPEIPLCRMAIIRLGGNLQGITRVRWWQDEQRIHGYPDSKNAMRAIPPFPMHPASGKVDMERLKLTESDSPAVAGVVRFKFISVQIWSNMTPEPTTLPIKIAWMRDSAGPPLGILRRTPPPACTRRSQVPPVPPTPCERDPTWTPSPADLSWTAFSDR